MWCITIQDGNDIRQLFYKEKNKDKALIKMNDLIVDQINYMLKDNDELPLIIGNKIMDLQSILNLIIKLQCGLENYDENRYEVTLSKFEFEDKDDN